MDVAQPSFWRPGSYPKEYGAHRTSREHQQHHHHHQHGGEPRRSDGAATDAAGRMDVDFLYDKVKTFFVRENLLSKIEIAKERAQRRIVIYVLPDQKGHHDYSPPNAPFLPAVPQDFTQHRDRSLHHAHLGVVPPDKYFQCTECPFNCKGASDFANHLVVHSVEHRDHNMQLMNNKGNYDHHHSSHHHHHRSGGSNGCQFHEGPCENPAVCDFLAKERRDQQLLKQQQSQHQHHQHQSSRSKEMDRNGHELMPMAGNNKVEQRAQLTSNCVMEVDADGPDSRNKEDMGGSTKVWELQPMKSSYQPEGGGLDCRVCGFTFFHKKDLKKHMLIHTGEKPYQCHLCGKAFASATVLNKHILNHNQNKPFKCTKCNRSFSTQDKLDKHSALHEAGGRADSFVCTTCSVPFTRYSNLMRHCLAQNHPAPLINREKGRRPKDPNQPQKSLEDDPQRQQQQQQQHQQEPNSQQPMDEATKAALKKKDCLKWTELEDSWLLNGVREFGKGHWKQILEKYRSYFQYGRNRFTLRLRYAYLCKTGRVELGVEPSLLPENQAEKIIGAETGQA